MRLPRRLILLGSLLLNLPAAGDASQVEDLVRRTWFEGLPIAQAAGLGEADGQLLAAMLVDPAEATHSGNIVMALGACGCGPAFEALTAFDAAAGVDEQAARRAIPQAMGLLARSDPRALVWLEERARGPLPPKGALESRRRYALVLHGLAQSRAENVGALLATIEAAAIGAEDAGASRWAAQARNQWLRDTGRTQ